MKLRRITDDGVSASFGLAADEVLARNPDRPTLRLYTYRSHCALVGRFQNVENEINVKACRRFGIDINHGCREPAICGCDLETGWPKRERRF